jgi:hypothetical protein
MVNDKRMVASQNKKRKLYKQKNQKIKKEKFEGCLRLSIDPAQPVQRRQTYRCLPLPPSSSQKNACNHPSEP